MIFCLTVTLLVVVVPIDRRVSAFEGCNCVAGRKVTP
jgi:hypothetical protein